MKQQNNHGLLINKSLLLGRNFYVFLMTEYYCVWIAHVHCNHNLITIHLSKFSFAHSLFTVPYHAAHWPWSTIVYILHIICANETFKFIIIILTWVINLLPDSPLYQLCLLWVLFLSPFILYLLFTYSSFSPLTQICCFVTLSTNFQATHVWN